MSGAGRRRLAPDLGVVGLWKAIAQDAAIGGRGTDEQASRRDVEVSFIVVAASLSAVEPGSWGSPRGDLGIKRSLRTTCPFCILDPSSESSCTPAPVAEPLKWNSLKPSRSNPHPTR
jgi:hypothetical protein